MGNDKAQARELSRYSPDRRAATKAKLVEWFADGEWRTLSAMAAFTEDKISTNAAIFAYRKHCGKDNKKRSIPVNSLFEQAMAGRRFLICRALQHMTEEDGLHVRVSGLIKDMRSNKEYMIEKGFKPVKEFRAQPVDLGVSIDDIEALTEAAGKTGITEEKILDELFPRVDVVAARAYFTRVSQSRSGRSDEEVMAFTDEQVKEWVVHHLIERAMTERGVTMECPVIYRTAKAGKDLPPPDRNKRTAARNAAYRNTRQRRKRKTKAK